MLAKENRLGCELLSGGIQIGDKVRFYEIVIGMDYNVTGTIIRAERDKDHFFFHLRERQKLPSLHLKECAPKQAVALAIQRDLECRRQL